MKTDLNAISILPPRLSMDEYVDFLEESIKTVSKEHRTMQKELEEVITAPFRLHGIVKHVKQPVDVT